MKLQAAKSLQLYMVRKRADQDNTEGVEATLEEAFRRLNDLELRFE